MCQGKNIRTGNDCKNKAKWRLDEKIYCGIHCGAKYGDREPLDRQQDQLANKVEVKPGACTVIRLRKKNGTLLTPYDIWIGPSCRTGAWKEMEKSKWYMSMRATPNKPLQQCLDEYRQYVSDTLADDLPELEGKILGCFCDSLEVQRPYENRIKYPICHGEVLMGLLTEYRQANQAGSDSESGEERERWADQVNQE